ncbi:Dephospho-CoA kinase [hydrothermal vent metagenome]|uniref:Dephospho-CoA kinase n=1 Tax=hydrothermal vent metagenome TaxID=652676 RepID=A0A3B0WXN2_9ZZZZ
MLKIGLTGGIGSGKTAASEIFERLGIDIIDTDVISRQLINHDKPTIKIILNTFGENILTSDKSIDRKKLARIVFSDKDKKQLLENILHPKIRDEVNKQILSLSQSSAPNYIIVVIPLLLETGFNDIIDRVLVVLTDEGRRIDRVLQRDERNLDEIHSIITHQVRDETRIKAADDIITNNRDIKHLQSQVRQLDKKYRQM